MITSRLIKKQVDLVMCKSNILETYVTRINSLGKGELFVNPSKSELLSIYKTSRIKYVRFILDNVSKKVYVWDSDIATHEYVSSLIGIYNRYNQELPDNMLIGAAKFVNGESIVVDSSDTLEPMIYYVKHNDPKSNQYKPYLSKIDNTDWSWANPYIDSTKYLEKLRKLVR